MAKTKTFNAQSLNALSSAIETIDEGISNPVASEVVLPAIAAPAQEEQSRGEVATVQPSNLSTVQTDVTSKKPNKSARKSADKQGRGEEKPAEPQPVKGLNVPLPLSVYDRMHMAAWKTGRTKKDIGLEAIVKWLDKMGY